MARCGEPDWGGRMLSRVLGFVSADMAIDLGTANTLVYVPGRGIVLDEPSVVAVTQQRDGDRRVIAVGYEAKTMLGRTATQIERRAVHEAGLSAGARRVYLIEEPIAAAIGAGLPIQEPRGSMVVDIGGGTTDIAVLSMGSVLYSRSVRSAGNSFDEAIVNYVRFKYNLLIGATSAESIKKESGCAIAKVNGERMPIHLKGRDLHRGFPADIALTSDDIPQALNLPIQQIVGGIRQALADAPPPLTPDICDSGIYLTGGGALLDRLDARLSPETR